MATSTPYLNLVKPAYSETADIGVLNENADKIDQAVSGQAQAIAGKPDDATEMPLGPNDTTLVSQAITNLQNEIGIVCTGNSCAISASTGQYVVLKNSTISGRADGLYTAAKTIPANTEIDSTYLTAVSSGGLNDLKGKVDSLNSKLAALPVINSGIVTCTQALASCTGTLIEGLSYTLNGNYFMLCGRCRINVTAKTDANPGISVTLPNGKKIDGGFNISSGKSDYSTEPRNGEGVSIIASNDSSTIYVRASESYTNVQGGKILVLSVPPVVIKVK